VQGGLKHGNGRIEYADGRLYEGQFYENELRDGSLTVPNCKTDRGTFLEGVLHGIGARDMIGEYVYEGSFQDGMRHGEGSCTWSDGRQYSGWWDTDGMTGAGTLHTAEGDQITGIFEDGLLSGTGSMSRRSRGGVCESGGCTVGGLLHGIGKRSVPGEYTHEGGFDKGLRSSYGVSAYPDGSTYDGQWVEDRFGGAGVHRGCVGVYEGEFVFGMKQGEGTLTWSHDGAVYTGQWSNDRQDGQGSHIYPDGSHYAGKWSDGYREGVGILVEIGGCVLAEGDWVRDVIHGEGVMFRVPGPQGWEYKGRMENGLRHGPGVCTFADGGVFTGQFDRGLMSGEGDWLKGMHGEAWRGSFRDGLLHGSGKREWGTGFMEEGHFSSGKLDGCDNHRVNGEYSYSGCFHLGMREGEGTNLNHLDGSQYTGQWGQGGVYHGDDAIVTLIHAIVTLIHAIVIL